MNSQLKFLRCPRDKVIVDRFTCDKCDCCVDIRTEWEGPVNGRRLNTRIDCVSGITRFSIVAVEADDVEGLSEL